MKFLLCILALWLVSVPVFAQMPDLIISEYIEGSAYNKALEIFNGTDDQVTLSAYTLELYANGSTVPSIISLGSLTLDSREVFVVANPSAAAEILNETDLVSALLNFNGNDALVLRRSGQVIDRLGQVGFDPGTSWNCVNGSTYNTTLRRQNSVCTGDLDLFDPFDPCYEYDFFPSDTFDDLGVHYDDCQSVGNGATSWDALKANFK